MNRNKKSWNVILFSNPKESVKKIYITKTNILILFSLLLITLILVFSFIYLQFQEKNVKNAVLTNELDEKNHEIAEKDMEIEQARNDYLTLQEDAQSVQKAIDEFKAFEEKLSNMELEIPGDELFQFDDSIEGSGGLEHPFNTEYSNRENIVEEMAEIKKKLPELRGSFENTIEQLQAYKEYLKTIPTIKPVKGGRITSRFGNRIDPFSKTSSFHSGIDIAASINTPIIAAADGEVVQAGWDSSGHGNKIVIKHDGAYETSYSHLNNIHVSVGDRVNKGEQIGSMGSTGRSTGSHLHYEIKKYGQFEDPYVYMTFND